MAVRTLASKGFLRSWRKGLGFSLMLSCLTACAKPPVALNLERLSQEIHRLTNEMRAEKKLAPLDSLSELDGLARRHSQNMAKTNFFDHVDPQGNSPADRMAKFLPQLLSANSGENIALRSIEGDESAMAQTLMRLWHDSPEHYQDIINPDYQYLGVGVEQLDDKIYATQTFASVIALLENSLPAKVTAGTTVTLRFRFLAGFPSSELSAFLTVPDGTARIPAGNGSAYIGKGPMIPVWTDAGHFELTVPTRYGLGNYQVRLGHQSAYYDKVFQFEAVSAL